MPTTKMDFPPPQFRLNKRVSNHLSQGQDPNRKVTPYQSPITPDALKSTRVQSEETFPPEPRSSRPEETVRKGVGAEVTGKCLWGSWRVVEHSRSPCPRGARHILEPAGKASRARESSELGHRRCGGTMGAAYGWRGA